MSMHMNSFTTCDWLVIVSMMSMMAMKFSRCRRCLCQWLLMCKTAGWLTFLVRAKCCVAQRSEYVWYAVGKHVPIPNRRQHTIFFQKLCFQIANSKMQKSKSVYLKSWEPPDKPFATSSDALCRMQEQKSKKKVWLLRTKKELIPSESHLMKLSCDAKKKKRPDYVQKQN